jgi:glutaconate CoA-transferase subunit B
MYFTVQNVILFRPEHSRRVFVKKVDFISAPGVSNARIQRNGGPKALITDLCLMSFNLARARFKLETVHPGHSVEEVLDNTGFDIDIPDNVPTTNAPSEDQLNQLRNIIAPEIAKTYPKFATKIFGIKSAV